MKWHSHKSFNSRVWRTKPDKLNSRFVQERIREAKLPMA
jgi:hypothetical protein